MSGIQSFFGLVLCIPFMPFAGTVTILLFGNPYSADAWTWALSILPMFGMGVAMGNIFF